jgi:subtilisin family serine protease
MKRLNFYIPIFLAIGILVTSQLVLGIPAPGTIDNSVRDINEVQVQSASTNNIEQGLAEASPIDNNQSLQLVSSIQSQPIVLDDQFADKQWALTSLKISPLWQLTMGSQEVLVAILDTGIDSDHEDLSGQIVAEANFTQENTSDDAYGHGTHIAGIIAAKDNKIGIVGIAPVCRLLNVKVADDRGRCQTSDLAAGIIWAVDNGAKVINISIEIKESSSDLKEAIEYAWNNGALVVAAAGNNGGQDIVYPAYYDNCIAVAALKEDGSLAPLSNYGDWIDLAAPGFQIYSTLPDDSYGYESGTSFATAHVSGIAALLFSVVADTNGDGKVNDEVLAIIETSFQQTNTIGIGLGCIDASRIIIQ